MRIKIFRDIDPCEVPFFERDNQIKNFSLEINSEFRFQKIWYKVLKIERIIDFSTFSDQLEIKQLYIYVKEIT